MLLGENGSEKRTYSSNLPGTSRSICSFFC